MQFCCMNIGLYLSLSAELRSQAVKQRIKLIKPMKINILIYSMFHTYIKVPHETD